MPLKTNEWTEFTVDYPKMYHVHSKPNLWTRGKSTQWLYQSNLLQVMLKDGSVAYVKMQYWEGETMHFIDLNGHEVKGELLRWRYVDE
jgi:hypothetical protein